MTKPRSASDFPPGLQGGLEHDSEDHRLGETGQTGPEAPGDVDRSHAGADRASDSSKIPPARPQQSRREG
ncbi:hypothetical protein DES44_2900 [Roseateles depolymerans]|uniref:Uncharacterized protein n=1 Tax=Roseateles depolymerans TaxID=76731 RepID=A0A0U3CW51_9BURK|nr:hypothetical protein [Roseateles depolymerans]ALV05574.1 hypothetical protein RD2015_1081 [Roseateles depolymerans]REG14405.1 hypothetical protein DES44_2900 [Roseateles depolymerans]